MKNNSKQIRQTIDNIVSAASRLSPFLHDGTVTLEMASLYLSNDFMSALCDLFSEVDYFCSHYAEADVLLNLKVREVVRSVLSGEESVVPSYSGGSGTYFDNLIRIVCILRRNDMIDDEELPDFIGISNLAKSTDRSMEEFYDQVFILFCSVKCVIMDNMNKMDSLRSKTSSDLDTPQAKGLWKKLQDAGIVDENLMPINLSHYQAAIVASCMKAKMKPSPSWKAFEELWNISNLSTKLTRASKMKYYKEYCECIDNTLK